MRALVACAYAAVVVAGCSKHATAPIATLVELAAQVERVPAADAPWRSAAIGDEFFLGSAIRTGAGAHARLRLGDKGSLDVDASSVVYFTNTLGVAGGGLQVETGAIEIEAGDEAVGFGDAVIEPHARARIATDGDGLSITATFGRVVVEGSELAPRAQVALGRDGKRRAIPARKPDEPARPAVSVASDRVDAGVDAGADPPADDGPATATLSITAGESPTIHDSHAPTAVGVRFDSPCAGTGVLEVATDARFRHLSQRRTGSAGRAIVALAAGSYWYRVRCDAGIAGAGTIRVVRDSGRAPLPKTAPHTDVDADGREYTILYQTLLPELTLGWRNPRNSVQYTFVISGPGGERRIDELTPQTTIASGKLGEGKYTFHVETPHGRSETTRIVIEFDNATPSASLESIVADGDGIAARGVVLPGSTVTSAGSAVELDRHNRFSAHVSAAEGETGVAVRIAHARTGVHYYVLKP